MKVTFALLGLGVVPLTILWTFQRITAMGSSGALWSSRRHPPV